MGSPPNQIRIQLNSLHQFQFAGYYAAKEKGFYTDEGLNVTLKVPESEENQIAFV